MHSPQAIFEFPEKKAQRQRPPTKEEKAQTRQKTKTKIKTKDSNTCDPPFNLRNTTKWP